jgi:RimJ/RimL family protein N-acetyltransferase
MSAAYTIRQFTTADWQLYKAIRLEALRSEPGVFASSYDQQSEHPDEYWHGRLASKSCAYFGLFADGELVGMTGVMCDEGNINEAELIASYIRPEHRENKLSRLFYQARIEWARATGIERLIISHRESNISSRQANQHFGFQFTHRVLRHWHDGMWEDNLYYELVLL